MLACLAAVVLLPSSPDTGNLIAKESLWVYAHASEPSADEYIRVWGANGTAAPENGGGGEDFSFGYLRFDVSALQKGKPKKAILVLHNMAPASFDEATAKDTPLQARALIGTFDIKTWAYEQSANVVPGPAKTVFGNGKLVGPLDKTAPAEIDIDLLQGPGDFAAALEKAEASPGHDLLLALTSAIDPNTEGGGAGKTGVYKVFSAAAKDEGMRPTLRLTW